MEKKQRIFSWQKKLFLIFCTGILTTGCSEKTDSNETAMKYSQTAWEQSDEMASDMESEDSIEFDMDSYSGTSVYEAEEKTQSNANETKNTVSSEKARQADIKEVRKEMLVYHGTLSIDTLHFNQSILAFKKQIEENGGFIETETFSDAADKVDDYYAVEEVDKHNLFTATVRIPSSKYNAVMDSAGDIGDLRNKQSNAENVTQQYSTYQSELQVYETQYKRYLKLLKNAKGEKYALQLEEKIFDLQVSIADLKSSITNLETDVAYSYIDITIREVIKYQSKIKEKETFLQRMKETCSHSWMNFLGVLESILFLLIHIWYYIVLVLLVMYCILRFKKHHTKKEGAAKITPENKNPEDNADSSEN